MAPLYMGLGGHVVAVTPVSGDELWRTPVKSSSYVTIWWSTIGSSPEQTVCCIV